MKIDSTLTISVKKIGINCQGTNEVLWIHFGDDTLIYTTAHEFRKSPVMHYLKQYVPCDEYDKVMALVEKIPSI